MVQLVFFHFCTRVTPIKVVQRLTTQPTGVVQLLTILKAVRSGEIVPPLVSFEIFLAFFFIILGNVF